MMFCFSRPQKSVTMATHIGEVPVNGHNKHEESAVLMTGSDGQAPVLDDSVIVDDDGGLPLISAVYSLATDGKSEESAFSGQFSFTITFSESECRWARSTG